MDQFLLSLKQKNKLWNIFITCFLLIVATGIAFLLFFLVPENLANIALIYILALILISRYTTGYVYGIFSSLFCVIFVNFFFTYPYFELNFTLTGYPITFLQMLAITMITSTTTSHMMEQSKIIAQREKQLMEADKEKMRANLLRAVSHDLRTPLTSIIVATSTYLDNASNLENSEKREIVQHIYDDSNWLLHMVENLLSVTRIQNSSSKVIKTSEIVEEVVSEAVTRLKKRIPEAQIIVSVPNEVLILPMDAMLIEQVLINLLENAIIHAHSTQPINLKITTTESSVVFHVIDYGIGINEHKIKDIFDGIPSDDSHVADSRKGMGIGLSICKTIILAHDGNISAINHNIGAEFLFELPKEEDYEK